MFYSTLHGIYKVCVSRLAQQVLFCSIAEYSQPLFIFDWSSGQFTVFTLVLFWNFFFACTSNTWKCGIHADKIVEYIVLYLFIGN